MSRIKFQRAFPGALKAARECAGLTQAELAKKLGLTQDWISHFECGRRMPNAYGLYLLWRELEVLHFLNEAVKQKTKPVKKGKVWTKPEN